MNTKLHTVQPKANRRATHEEIEQAAIALRSVDGALADLIESDYALNRGNNIAVVVTDFGDVPDSAPVLLVPSGTYRVPAEVLGKAQFIVGLAWKQCDYPVLDLQVEPTPVTNSDTLEETDLCVAPCSARLIRVALEAAKPTVLEIILGGEKEFSDVFFNVNWQDSTDAYDQANCTALNGRDWLIAAYGESLCRPRNTVEKGLDAFHKGIMNAIDNVFLPLVRAAEKVDKLLGLK